MYAIINDKYLALDIFAHEETNLYFNEADNKWAVEITKNTKRLTLVDDLGEGWKCKL